MDPLSMKYLRNRLVTVEIGLKYRAAKHPLPSVVPLPPLLV